MAIAIPAVRAVGGIIVSRTVSSIDVDTRERTQAGSILPRRARDVFFDDSPKGMKAANCSDNKILENKDYILLLIHC